MLIDFYSMPQAEKNFNLRKIIKTYRLLIALLQHNVVTIFLSQVFHRILDLKRGWIFILAPFLLPLLKQAKKIHQLLQTGGFSFIQEFLLSSHVNLKGKAEVGETFSVGFVFSELPFLACYKRRLCVAARSFTYADKSVRTF